MTLAVASWLMEDPNNLEVLVKEMQFFGNRYPKAGYGGMFRKWLVDKNPKPYNSFGNGSAMRVSPCAWVAKSLPEAETLAETSAIVTHNHPEGIKGAKAVAAAIYMAKKGADKKLIKNYIETTYGYNLSRTIQEIKDSGYNFDSTCQGSVPESIIAFLESDDFEDCIRKAIWLGGDADTQAAIAGSIAEAYYGRVPGQFIGIVEKKLDAYLLSVLNKFNNFVK
jgi:ADP-ribosylglycohydrolase